MQEEVREKDALNVVQRVPTPFFTARRVPGLSWLREPFGANTHRSFLRLWRLGHSPLA